jgi:hypothetical protein
MEPAGLNNMTSTNDSNIVLVQILFNMTGKLTSSCTPLSRWYAVNVTGVAGALFTTLPLPLAGNTEGPEEDNGESNNDKSNDNNDNEEDNDDSGDGYYHFQNFRYKTK